MPNLTDITLVEANIRTIIDTLDMYGICVIHNYLDSTELTGLNDEHDSVFTNAGPGILSVEDHAMNKGGKVARCRPMDMNNKYRLTKQIFLSEFLQTISSEYFGSNDVILNNDVFFTHEVPSDRQILPWHFDRIQALKFYINLIDVDESNGALEYDLGSHREGHFRANFYILSGVPIGQIPNDIPARELTCPITIAVQAGDLVIFDPDGFHRGGIILKGNQRKVVRGHTHPLPNRGFVAKRFDSLWWLNTPFNLAKQLCTKAARILPDKRLTGAARRSSYK